MARKPHKPAEIVAKLRQVKVPVGQASWWPRVIGVTEATYDLWRAE